MNTSELYFNTPVIDDKGKVKQLSDFGGGGGGSETVTLLQEGVDYNLGSVVASKVDLKIYKKGKTVVMYFNGLKLNAGGNTWEDIIVFNNTIFKPATFTYFVGSNPSTAPSTTLTPKDFGVEGNAFKAFLTSADANKYIYGQHLFFIE